MSTLYDNKTDVLTMICDNCGEEAEFSGICFSDALDEAKVAGWVVRRNKYAHGHYCSRQCEASDDFD